MTDSRITSINPPRNGLDKTDVESICLDLEAIVPLLKFADRDPAGRDSASLLNDLLEARIACLRDLIEGK